MQAALKDSIHRLTNKMQGIIGFLEIGQSDKALCATKEGIIELAYMASVISALPEDEPHS